MKILVLNGPNLNMLGKRDHHQYGTKTLAEIDELLKEKAKAHKAMIHAFQSNHEGELIDFLQEHAGAADGILINPGALTHYGYSLRDAIADTGLPTVEVHLSDVENREEFRKLDVLDGIVLKRITGMKEKSYLEGLRFLLAHLQTQL